MGVRNLAEAVILQSMEDLWDPEYREESRDFFSGDAFRICSEIAGIDNINKFKLIYFLEGDNHGKPGRLHRT